MRKEKSMEEQLVRVCVLFCVLFTIILMFLKVLRVLTLAWLWVFAPVWIPLLIVFLWMVIRKLFND